MTHELHFSCTMCGRCCRDAHLPLTNAEALAWLADGHEVEVLCAAMPWPVEPPTELAEPAYRRARSFVAHSGALGIRVNVMLAANLGVACPNLGPDLLCRIHARRPLVCRISPAEVNPFVHLRPQVKACPPEAWGTEGPLFQRDTGVVLGELQADVAAAREAASTEVDARGHLCADLGLHTAAVDTEGYVVHAVERTSLTAALQRALGAPGPFAPERQWGLVSDRPLTLDALAAVGAVAVPAHGRETPPPPRPWRYLSAAPSAAAAALTPAGAALGPASAVTPSL